MIDFGYFSTDLPGNIKIKNLDGSINNGILMEAQQIAQSVFDESYENDPKNEQDCSPNVAALNVFSRH